MLKDVKKCYKIHVSFLIPLKYIIIIESSRKETFFLERNNFKIQYTSINFALPFPLFLFDINIKYVCVCIYMLDSLLNIPKVLIFY